MRWLRDRTNTHPVVRHASRRGRELTVCLLVLQALGQGIDLPLQFGDLAVGFLLSLSARLCDDAWPSSFGASFTGHLGMLRVLIASHFEPATRLTGTRAFVVVSERVVVAIQIVLLVGTANRQSRRPGLRRNVDLPSAIIARRRGYLLRFGECWTGMGTLGAWVSVRVRVRVGQG